MGVIERRIADKVMPWAAARATVWPSTAAQNATLLDEVRDAQKEIDDLRDQLAGAVEALYSAHDFIGRVSAWTGDPDEAVELLDEIAKHLPAAGRR